MSSKYNRKQQYQKADQSSFNNRDNSKLHHHYDDVSHTGFACSLCKSALNIFDPERGEVICNGCGMVLQDNFESLGKERQVYTYEDIECKVRTGPPTSLAFHDMGLSTAISYSNVDAFGASIRPEQIGKLKRMRRWNSTSDSNNKAYSRNLIKAFAIMARIKDKLSLSDSVIEGAAYLYRKARKKAD